MKADPRFPVGSIGIDTVADSFRAGRQFDDEAARYQRNFDQSMASYAAQFPTPAPGQPTKKESQTP